MIKDYLQESLKLLLPETPDWYGWAKTDSEGNVIPNSERMQTKYVIVTESHIGKVTRPTDKQINDKVAELQADYDAKKYQRDRAVAFPSLQEQLDMQYWDKVNGTNKWQEAVAKVKADNPKPE